MARVTRSTLLHAQPVGLLGPLHRVEPASVDHGVTVDQLLSDGGPRPDRHRHITQRGLVLAVHVDGLLARDTRIQGARGAAPCAIQQVGLLGAVQSHGTRCPTRRALDAVGVGARLQGHREPTHRTRRHRSGRARLAHLADLGVHGQGLDEHKCLFVFTKLRGDLHHVAPRRQDDVQHCAVGSSRSERARRAGRPRCHPPCSGPSSAGKPGAETPRPAPPSSAGSRRARAMADARRTPMPSGRTGPVVICPRQAGTAARVRVCTTRP
jgi:hypothetical protein